MKMISRRSAVLSGVLVVILIGGLAIVRQVVRSQDSSHLPSWYIRDARTRAIDLAKVKRGSSSEAIQEQYGGVGKHQFTVGRDDSVVQCVSYAFNEAYRRLYFVFVDNRLMKIVEPPPFEFQIIQVPFQGRMVRKSVRAPWDPGEQINAVLAAKDLTELEVADFIAYQAPEGESNIPGILGWLVVVTGNHEERRREYERNEKLSRVFDPCDVSIGMSIENVDRIFGPPRRSVNTEDDWIVRIYGGERLARVSLLLKHSWVSVEFVEQRAVRILSGDFLKDEYGPDSG